MNRSPQLGPESFTALARSSLRAAYAGALRVVARPADAEDVAQDALLAAFEKRQTCRDPERFRAWLLRIVRNRALNWIEHRRLRDVPATAAEPRVEVQLPHLPDVGLQERLRAALATLSPIRRTVVLLHDTEGWTHEEIAEHLRISVLMSRKHLFQARGALRPLLAEDDLDLRRTGHANRRSAVIASRRPARPALPVLRSGDAAG